MSCPHRLKTLSSPCLLAIGLATSSYAADWPQLQCDAAKSGFQPTERIVTSKHSNSTPAGGFGLQAWAWTNTTLAGQPVVAEGIVAIGSVTNGVFALDELTGAVRWSADVGGAVLNACAITDGKVIAGTQAGRLCTLAVSNGATVWTYSGATKGFAAAPTVAGGSVFIGSKDGRFHALDLATGQAAWIFHVGGTNDAEVATTPILCSAAVMSNRVYFGAENMHAYALDARTGTRLWRQQVRGQSFRMAEGVASAGEGGGVSYGAGWVVASRQSGGTVIFRTQPVYSFHTGLNADESFIESVTGTNWTGNPLGDTTAWIREQRAISQRLRENPHRRSLWELNAATGADRFAEPLPVLYTTGTGNTPAPPVVDDTANHAWVILRSVYARFDGVGVRAYGELARLNLAFDPAIYTNAALGALGFDFFPCGGPSNCKMAYEDFHKIADEGEVLTGCQNAILSSTWVSDGGVDTETGLTFNIRVYSSDDSGNAPLYGAGTGVVVANGRVVLRDSQGIKSYVMPSP
jgi:outer membrane protein assembly factor BamB